MWDLEDLEDGDFTVEIPTEIKTAEDAKRTLAALKKVAGKLSELDSRDDNVQKAVDDMMKSLQVLQAENAERPAAEVVGANERDLSRYIGPEGELRMLGQETSFEFAGKTWKGYEPGLLDDGENVCQWQKDLKVAVNRRNTARLLQRNPNTPTLDARVARLLSRAPSPVRKAAEEHVKRALESGAKTRAFSNTSGAGAEWIPEQFIPELYEAAQVRGDIRGQFEEIQTNSDSFRRPKVSNTVRPYIKTQISSDNPANYTASTPTTADQSYTVPSLSVRILVDEAASEDSAIAGIPTLSRLATDAIADGIRDAVINGDSTATHQDAIASWNLRSRWGSTGLGGSADHRRIFKGLRRQAVDRSNTLDMGSIQTTAGLLQLMAVLGERAASNLRIFTSPEVMFQKLMGLSEVITLEKFGNRATIVSGQLADIFGVPIIPTRFMGADLAAAGLYTGSGSKSGLVVVDTGGYYFYSRRGEMVEVQKIISSGHYEIVVTIRLGFDTPDDSTADNVAFGYNWL